MRLVEHPERIAALPDPTAKDPWRVLMSGCMAGWPCGVDGTDYGMRSALAGFGSLRNVQLVPFCPEDVGLGTPRTMPDIHGGDGFAVLDGKARLARDPDDNVNDWADVTPEQIAEWKKMQASKRKRR